MSSNLSFVADADAEADSDADADADAYIHIMYMCVYIERGTHTYVNTYTVSAGVQEAPHLKHVLDDVAHVFETYDPNMAQGSPMAESFAVYI